MKYKNTQIMNEMSIQKESMDALINTHEKECTKIRLEFLDQIEKHKMEIYELTEDKN